LQRIKSKVENVEAGNRDTNGQMLDLQRSLVNIVSFRTLQTYLFTTVRIPVFHVSEDIHNE